MARKRQEVVLQQEVNTQEEWEETLQKEGLLVVDVYQDWCGPCKAVQGFFRRLKNETGDELLQFAVAKADGIESLERYRGKCEPCFLMYGSGYLVAVIRGANPPELERTIMKKLDEEKKVMKGEMEREEIKDTGLAEEEEKTLEEDEEEKEEVEREVTLALIKPDAVEEGRVEEIIEKLRDNQIEILRHEERQLTSEEARDFYTHLKDMDFFENLIDFMSSGISHILVLSKGHEGIISEFRELLGPPMVEAAKEEAPESLRSQFGKETFKNALHGASDKDQVKRELQFFFPDFVMPTIRIPKDKIKLETTIALVRPDANALFKDKIKEQILEKGFRIAMEKEMTMTQEEAEEFYKDLAEEPYYQDLVDRMCSGPLLAMSLAKTDAVEYWKQLLGPANLDDAKFDFPDCWRAQFAVDDVEINQLHGSESIEASKKEHKLFFPKEFSIAAIKPDAYENRAEIIESIQEAGFHVVVDKEIQLDEETAKEFYKDLQGKEYFEELIQHMISGNTLFLILCKVDGVNAFRNLVGPTDPEEASTSNPDSLRATYGTDIKMNAIHASSSLEHAKRCIELIFGDIELKDPEEEQEAKDGIVDSEERVVMEAEVAEGAAEDEEKGEAAEETTDGEAEKPPTPTEGEPPTDGDTGGTAAAEEEPAPEESESHEEKAQEESEKPADDVGGQEETQEPEVAGESEPAEAQSDAPPAAAPANETPAEEEKPESGETETQEEQPQETQEHEAPTTSEAAEGENAADEEPKTEGNETNPDDENKEEEKKSE